MKEKNSNAFAEIAKQLGSDVQNPKGFDPQTGLFYTLEGYLREKEAIGESLLRWLLNLGQQDRRVLTPTDTVVFQSFVEMYASASFEASLETIHHIAAETVDSIRRFAVERIPWEIQLPGMRRVVEWSGPYRMSAFRTDDWQAAFRLFATELVCEYGDRIRVCKRQECERLFLAGDKRQVFCSRECSQKVQFEKYVKGIGGKKAWLKKHREQYHSRKKAVKDAP